MPASAKGERVGAEVEEKLVKHIDEAYAMEQNVLRMLDGMIPVPRMRKCDASSNNTSG